MGGTCSSHGEKRNVYRIFVEKPEEKTPLERLDVGGKIIVYLSKIEFGDVGWIYRAQDGDRWRALVNTVMKLVSMKCD
jgi:hypothetical protein